MAKKKTPKKVSKTEAPIMLTEDEMQQMARGIGMMMGRLSRLMLQAGGCEVDFKINGESIDDIEKLQAFDIKQRIKLAVKEERYEDASALKKLLESKK